MRLNRNASSSLIAAKLREKILKTQDMSIDTMKDELKNRFSLEVNNNLKLYRARAMARGDCIANHKSKLRKLRMYGEMLLSPKPKNKVVSPVRYLRANLEI